ncbi:MAG: thiamine-phosphate kinase [Candidatus Nezhaarchaeota archaeon]|nr:thiamine-phosphate kinase [Candidatus Nezhaarchaeota archaeon]
MSVSEVGEWKLIEAIWDVIERDPEEVMGANDDVVARRIGGNKLLVSHVDTLAWSTDVLPGMTPHSIGFKSVIMNVSDMAAKGVRPLGMLFSLGVPRNCEVKCIEEIAKGWRDAAAKYRLHVWGGDITEAPELMLTGAIMGITGEGKIMRRRGASEGDLVACIGTFGLTSVAYLMLLQGRAAPSKIVELKAKRAAYYPKAHLKEGMLLARTGAVTASMDCSDGLAWSLHTLCSLNNVGMVIKCIPMPPEVEAYAKAHGLDPIDLALYGGEEYSLIFTLKRSSLKSMPKSLVRKMYIMGEVTSDKKLRLLLDEEEKEIEKRGWEHLRR